MSSERSGHKQDSPARCGYRAEVVPLPPGPALPRDAQERVAAVPDFRVTPGAATGSVELRAARQGLAPRCFTAVHSPGAGFFPLSCSSHVSLPVLAVWKAGTRSLLRGELGEAEA